MTLSSSPSISTLSTLPSNYYPMLLGSAKQPFNHDDWVHEPKLDGMRIIAFADKHHARLFSRSGRDVTSIFPEICAALRTVGHKVILDGELIATDADGRPDFDNLQKRWMLCHSSEIREAETIAPTAFYAFDLLGFKSKSLLPYGYAERKKILQSHVEANERLKIIRSFQDGKKLFETTREQGLEGIVSKKSNSLYYPGERSKHWIKVKHKQQTIVVILAWDRDDGYLLGEMRDNDLRIAGYSKFGLTASQADRLIASLKPGPSIFATGKKELQWFEPTVWMNIEFMTRTKSGALRFPVFKGFAGIREH